MTGGGCVAIASLLADATSRSLVVPSSPLATHFAVDAIVRMCVQRPHVSGNLAAAGVVKSLVDLLTTCLLPSPSSSSFSSLAPPALRNYSLLSVICSAIGYLCLGNPRVASTVSESGVIPLLTTLVRGKKDSSDPRWAPIMEQAEFALKACVSPPPSAHTPISIAAATPSTKTRARSPLRR